MKDLRRETVMITYDTGVLQPKAENLSFVGGLWVGIQRMLLSQFQPGGIT